MITRILPTVTLSAATLCVLAAPAHAYLGPGLGAGTIAVVLGIAASVLIALFAVIWYPMKRMMKHRGTSEDANSDRSGAEEGGLPPTAGSAKGH